MTEDVMLEIRRHKDRQDAEKEKIGDRYEDKGLVFADQFGRPVELGQFSKDFKRLKDCVGLTEFCFHDLRATHCSQAAKSGLSVAEVSQRLGHFSIKMMDKYLHLFPDHLTASAQKMKGKFTLAEDKSQ